MSVVLVGYVPTPEGEAALEQAVREAGHRGARLLVVCSHRSADEQEVNGESPAEEVERLHEQLATTGLDYEVRSLVRGFEPAEDLISLAQVTGAELVVIGLRRRTPAGKMVLGDNAQRVLLDAPCPVLAVKDPLSGDE